MNGQRGFCKKCGTQYEENDSFCVNCGTSRERVLSPSLNKEPNRARVTPIQEKIFMVPPGKGKKPNLPIIAVVLAVFVLIAGAAFGVWFFKPQLFSSIPVIKNIVPMHYDLSDPRTYLPKENRRYVVHELYPDGDEQTDLEIVTAKLRPNVLLSAVEIIPQYEGTEDYYVLHYTEDSKGIYRVNDSNPKERWPWLQNNLSKGLRWEFGTEEGKVICTVQDVGVVCDLGFEKLKDCVTVEYDLNWGPRYIEYYAPGLGLVMRKDYRNGQTTYNLTSYKDIDAGQAQNMVSQHAKNIDKVQ